jgi:transposase-like protein
MSTVVDPEVRAKILTSIKDNGATIQEMAQTYSLHEDTIRRWVKGTAENGRTSTSEISRLRRDNQALKEILGNLLLERELQKKNYSRS